MDLPINWQDCNWQDCPELQDAVWHSDAGYPAPKRVVLADDTLSADAAYRLASEGTALLWQGDFHNAKQLLQALARRFDKKPIKAADNLTQAFHQHRMRQAQRTRLLGAIILRLESDYSIRLRRAPVVADACAPILGATVPATRIISLRALQGWIGAYEWRKKGVFIPALGQAIYPHYGVFSPVRGEYVELVAQAPLPVVCQTAFDIGTGTGVLAAVLAQRRITKITATDQDPRALACAQENLQHLGLSAQVQLQTADLFPDGRADLIVCNPPWLPAKATTPIEYAIYDPDSHMLKAFLQGVTAHLNPQGQAWVVMSNLAELLGLRKVDDLPSWIAQAGLQVLHKIDTRPHHPKSQAQDDPLYVARSQEITSLWCLGVLPF